MKKLTSLILAAAFAIAISLAVINNVASSNNTNNGNAYASIIPLPPPK